MFKIRIIGWVLFSLALLDCIIESITSTTIESYSALKNSEVLTILTGFIPEEHEFMKSAYMNLPSWTTFGIISLILLTISKKRIRKTSFSK